MNIYNLHDLPNTYGDKTNKGRVMSPFAGRLLVLEGVRNMPVLDKDKLAIYLLQLSQLVCDFPQIKEIGINPVSGLEKRCIDS